MRTIRRTLLVFATVVMATATLSIRAQTPAGAASSDCDAAGCFELSSTAPGGVATVGSSFSVDAVWPNIPQPALITFFISVAVPAGFRIESVTPADHCSPSGGGVSTPGFASCAFFGGTSANEIDVHVALTALTATAAATFTATRSIEDIGDLAVSLRLKVVAPTLLPEGGALVKPDPGTAKLEIVVRLSEPSPQTVAAEWNTFFLEGASNVQAKPGVDYTPASGTVTFAPGQTTQTVPISIIGGTQTAPYNVFVVSFHTPSNATMGGYWGLAFGLILANAYPSVTSVLRRVVGR